MSGNGPMFADCEPCGLRMKVTGAPLEMVQMLALFHSEHAHPPLPPEPTAEYLYEGDGDSWMRGSDDPTRWYGEAAVCTWAQLWESRPHAGWHTRTYL